MADWIAALDNQIIANRRKLLEGNGSSATKRLSTKPPASLKYTVNGKCTHWRAILTVLSSNSPSRKRIDHYDGENSIALDILSVFSR